MSLTLIREIGQSSQLFQPLTDLDMTKILTHVDARMNEKKALAFAEKYFSGNAEELSLRLDVLTELKTLTTASTLQEAIDALDAIAQEMEALKTAVTRLSNCIFTERYIAAYVHAVKVWNELLNHVSSEDPSLYETSERLKELRSFFKARQEESLFAQCETALQEMDEVMPLPRYINLALNLREDGYPLEMGVLNTEGHIDLRDPSATVDEPLNAFLSATSTQDVSRSVGPEFTYNRSIYGSHFDEYIAQTLEHEWKGKISKAGRILDKITLPAVEEMLSFREPMSFYQVALLCAEAFEARGYKLCRPVSKDNTSLEIRGALYPDFILHHEGIQGNDLTLRKGNAVIITGPNHSGKTSYLKTIGQCYMLAQMGFCVPAESMIFEPVHNIFSLFSAGEDSSMTASRMGVEVKKLTEILKTATASDLILLNEPMTSTNPVEAVSICSDLTRHFLEVGATHLLVTHLYDIYYLLKAQLKPELLERMESLITQSHYDEVEGHMVHSYRLIAHEPLGNSYARETAQAYGITLDAMISDSALLKEAERYCDTYNKDSVYEGDDSDGISDNNGR